VVESRATVGVWVRTGTPRVRTGDATWTLWLALFPSMFYCVALWWWSESLKS
jgi:hypothetical protein